MKKTLTALMALAAFSGTPAMADNHFYAEVNAGKNAFYSAADELKGNFKGFGWNGSLGYAFTDNVAAEIGFMQNAEKLNMENHLNVPYMAARFNLPMGERVDFVAKAGVMQVHHKGEKATFPYTGLGLSYALDERVDLTAMYQGGIYGIGGAGLMGLGLHYKF